MRKITQFPDNKNSGYNSKYRCTRISTKRPCISKNLHSFATIYISNNYSNTLNYWYAARLHHHFWKQEQFWQTSISQVSYVVEQFTSYSAINIVVVVSLLRMCQTHKHIQSNTKHQNEIKDLIKNIEYRTMV